MKPFLVAILLFLSVLPAYAFDPVEQLTDVKMEQRARSISAGLRCLVCQNENIDSSHAELAQQLRQIVRERLMAGDSNQQVVDYVHARYGDYVLLKPPFDKRTLLLWLAPFWLLIIGALVLWRQRRTLPAVDEAPLTEAERAELARLATDSARP